MKTFGEFLTESFSLDAAIKQVIGDLKSQGVTTSKSKGFVYTDTENPSDDLKSLKKSGYEYVRSTNAGNVLTKGDILVLVVMTKAKTGPKKGWNVIEVQQLQK